MENMKILLIIPMALIEIVFLGVCWLVAFAHKPTGARLVKWSLRTMPDKEWYYK